MTTVDVDSFSAAGVVEFTATGKAGLQTIVKFSRNFPKQPSVQLTPGNVNAAVNNMGYYVVAT